MVLVPPNRYEILTEKGDLTLRAAKFFEDLTNISNNTTDNINEKLPQSSVANQLLGKVLELEKRLEVIVPTTISSGVLAFETHICKNTAPITKTLDVNALEGDIVTIKRRGARVTIIGTINGETDLVINRKQSAPKLAFDGIDWSTV